MLDGRGHTRLAQHRRPHLLNCKRPALQDLEDDRTHQKRVIRVVHHAAAARSQFSNELVMLDCALLHAALSLTSSMVDFDESPLAAMGHIISIYRTTRQLRRESLQSGYSQTEPAPASSGTAPLYRPAAAAQSGR